MTQAGAATNTVASFGFPTNEYGINLSTGISFNANESRSFALWVYRTNDYSQNTIAYNSSQVGGNSHFGIESDNTLFLTNDGPQLHSTATILSGAWTHVVITIDTSKCTFYINGIWDSEVVTSAVNATVYDRIGWLGSPGGWNLVGGMDDLRFYNKVLTQAEVDFIYNSGSGTEDHG